MPTTDLLRRLAGARTAEGEFIFPDSVRVPCQCASYVARYKSRSAPIDRLCWIKNMDGSLGHTGWVASEKAWVWIAAVGVAVLVRQMEQGQWEAKDRLQMKVWDGPEAFYSAVLEAVQTLEGVQLD